MKNTTFNSKNKGVQQLLKNARSPFKMRLFYFNKLPSLWFWGCKLTHLDTERTAVELPYHWASKNPFRSIYFAAQCGAAEFSTGILCQLIVRGFDQKISMLVKDIQTEFTKKATSTTTFYCTDGAAVIRTVETAIRTGDAQLITMFSEGRMADGTVVSKTKLTWSIKCMD